MGSSFELETLLLAAQKVKYIKEEKTTAIMQNIHSIQKMLYALRKSNNLRK
jgi:four helix bundle protein